MLVFPDGARSDVVFGDDTEVGDEVVRASPKHHMTFAERELHARIAGAEQVCHLVCALILLPRLNHVLTRVARHACRAMREETPILCAHWACSSWVVDRIASSENSCVLVFFAATQMGKLLPADMSTALSEVPDDAGPDEASDNSPLHKAADAGDEVAVRELLNNSAPRNKANSRGA